MNNRHELTNEQVNEMLSQVVPEDQLNGMMTLLELSTEVEISSDKDNLYTLVGNIQKRANDYLDPFQNGYAIVYCLNRTNMRIEDILALNPAEVSCKFIEIKDKAYKDLLNEITDQVLDDIKLQQYLICNSRMILLLDRLDIQLSDLLKVDFTLLKKLFNPAIFIPIMGMMLCTKILRSALEDLLKLDLGTLMLLYENANTVGTIINKAVENNCNALPAQHLIEILCDVLSDKNIADTDVEETAVKEIKKAIIIKNAKILSLLQNNNNSFFKLLPSEVLAKISSLTGLDDKVIEHVEEAENIAYKYF